MSGHLKERNARGLIILDALASTPWMMIPPPRAPAVYLQDTRIGSFHESGGRTRIGGTETGSVRAGTPFIVAIPSRRSSGSREQTGATVLGKVRRWHD